MFWKGFFLYKIIYILTCMNRKTHRINRWSIAIIFCQKWKMILFEKCNHACFVYGQTNYICVVYFYSWVKFAFKYKIEKCLYIIVLYKWKIAVFFFFFFCHNLSLDCEKYVIITHLFVKILSIISQDFKPNLTLINITIII